MEILEAYRMLRNEDDNTNPSMLSMEETSMHYPNDAIRTKKGFHFTDDFKCVGREPGIRSTC